MKPYRFSKRRTRKWPRVVSLGIVLLVFLLAGGVVLTRRLYTDSLKPVNAAATEQKIFVVILASWDNRYTFRFLLLIPCIPTF